MRDSKGRFIKGNSPWHKGRKGVYDEEALNKMSKARKKNPSKYWKDKKRPEIGKLLAKKHKGKFVGDKNPAWRGGTRRISGYIYIWSPDHPNKSKQGYVGEHRLKIEKKLGRYLKPEEVVHHKNGIKDDNRLCNLKLFKNNAEHLKYENTHKCKKSKV